jgi:adenine-specific DNA-methyltransferase
MGNKQKLELTWIGKDVRPKLDPRILLEDSPSLVSSGRSYHSEVRAFTNGKVFLEMLA